MNKESVSHFRMNCFSKIVKSLWGFLATSYLFTSSLLETLEIILMPDQYFLKIIWNSPNQNYIILPDLESFPSIDCVYFGMKYDACFFK